MSLFENGKLEEFLFLFCNFNMNLAVSGTLEVSAKYQYLRTIVCREVFCQFDSLYADIEGIESLNVDYIIKGLAQYFTPLKYLSKHKRAMRHGMKKTRSLTVRRYTARLIYLNEYLVSFFGGNFD